MIRATVLPAVDDSFSELSEINRIMGEGNLPESGSEVLIAGFIAYSPNEVIEERYGGFLIAVCVNKEGLFYRAPARRLRALT